MASYIVRRLLLMIPTLLGILLLNFIIVQAAPGGPIDQMMARFEGLNSNASTGLESVNPRFMNKAMTTKRIKVGTQRSALRDQIQSTN